MVDNFDWTELILLFVDSLWLVAGGGIFFHKSSMICIDGLVQTIHLKRHHIHLVVCLLSVHLGKKLFFKGEKTHNGSYWSFPPRQTRNLARFPPH
jgi:hypothetical protein